MLLDGVRCAARSYQLVLVRDDVLLGDDANGGVAEAADDCSPFLRCLRAWLALRSPTSQHIRQTHAVVLAVAMRCRGVNGVGSRGIHDDAALPLMERAVSAH